MMQFLPMATGPFFSLNNTDFVVLLGFLVFLGILFFFKVPGRIAEMLDGRSAAIRKEVDEARALREEAQTLLASYERKQKEVQDQAASIVAAAKAEAEDAAAEARKNLEDSMTRRLEAATDQIASAEKAAVREVKDKAVNVAVKAAADVLKKNIGADKANTLIDNAISQVGAKLH